MGLMNVVASDGNRCRDWRICIPKFTPRGGGGGVPNRKTVISYQIVSCSSGGKKKKGVVTGSAFDTFKSENDPDLWT